jgi:hypothetical protein
MPELLILKFRFRRADTESSSAISRVPLNSNPGIRQNGGLQEHPTRANSLAQTRRYTEQEDLRQTVTAASLHSVASIFLHSLSQWISAIGSLPVVLRPADEQIPHRIGSPGMVRIGLGQLGSLALD